MLTQKHPCIFSCRKVQEVNVNKCVFEENLTYHVNIYKHCKVSYQTVAQRFTKNVVENHIVNVFILYKSCY